MATRVDLDRAGVREVLNSAPVASAVRGLAVQVEAATRSQLPPDVDVVTDSYTTDRSAASVTIRDARGRVWQIRDGVLTRAAGSVGLKVHSK